MRWRLLVFAWITVFYLTVLNARPDFARFNCDDSESYLALADSLVHGRGYTRSMIPGEYIPHTAWPPGLPLLLTPAVALAAPPVWTAAKCTMALIGLLGIVLVWLLVRRLGQHQHLADLAALLVALNPFYWDFSHRVMAEVPLTVWMVGGLLLVDLIWAGRRVRPWEALLVGLVCGTGMLLKGLVLGLLLVPIAYFRGTRKTLGNKWNLVTTLVLFSFAFVLPHAAWTCRNRATPASGYDGLDQLRMIRSKYPTDPASELLTLPESVDVVLKNVRHSVIYHLPQQVIPGLWNGVYFDWGRSGYLAMALSVSLLVLCLSWKQELQALHLLTWPMVLLNLSWAFGGNPRYWIPVSVLLTMLLMLRLRRFLTLDAFSQKLRVGLGSSILALNLACYVVDHERHPYNSGGPWSELAQLFAFASQEKLEPAGVLTPHNLAFQLTTGFPAPLPGSERDCAYDYVVARLDRLPPPILAQRQPLVTVFPWGLFSLLKPTPGRELLPAVQLHGSLDTE
jgi:hypothetical protein